VQGNDYVWVQNESNSFMFEVGMVGHNKKKLAQFVRAAQREIGEEEGIYYSLIERQIFAKEFDLTTLKQYPSQPWATMAVRLGVTEYLHHQVSFYEATIRFFLGNPVAAGAAVQFKLKNF
jgi:hypothetical protein